MYILSLKFFYFKGGTLMKQSNLSLSDMTSTITKEGNKNMSYVNRFIEERVVDNKDCKHDLS